MPCSAREGFKQYEASARSKPGPASATPRRASATRSAFKSAPSLATARSPMSGASAASAPGASGSAITTGPLGPASASPSSRAPTGTTATAPPAARAPSAARISSGVRGVVCATSGAAPLGTRSRRSEVNSSSAKSGRSFSASGPSQRRRSRSSATGRSQRIVARSFESRAVSASRASVSRSFFAPRTPLCSTASRCARISSTGPSSRTSVAAVFSPMPETPGMLSIGSPMRPRTSGTRAGSTPKRSRTSAGPQRRSRMVSSQVVRSSTSCIRSLSPVTITVSRPAPLAWRASVPITSSASTPGTSTTGRRSASTTFRT